MYNLRKLNDADVDLVQSWLEQEYIRKWFGDVADWMVEIKGRHDEYSFIKHFIAEEDGRPIGFCQYYDYTKLPLDDDETAEPEGTYGIDYMIGDEALLGKGLGKLLVRLISDQVLAENHGVVQLVADPTIEEGRTNVASIKVLEANKFYYDDKSELYRKCISQNNG